jgi:hypothetical protein
MRWLLLLALAGCGGSSHSSFGCDQNSAKGGACTDFSFASSDDAANAESVCVNGKHGTLIDSCPKDGRVYGCKTTNGSDTSTTWQYMGDPSSCAPVCTSTGAMCVGT